MLFTSGFPPAPPITRFSTTLFADLYNFNFQAAHSVVDREIAGHANDPLPYAVSASGYLFYELDRLATLESEFLIDDNRIVAKKNPDKPDPATRNQIPQGHRRCQDSRAESALAKENPNDQDGALFAMVHRRVVWPPITWRWWRNIRSRASLPPRKSNNYAQLLC